MTSDETEASALEPEDDAPGEAPRRWGPVATLFIALFVTFVPGILAGIAAAFVVGAQSRDAGAERMAAQMEETLTDGDFLGLAIWVGALLGIPLLLLALRLRGWSRRSAYLPFRPVSPRAVAVWIGWGAVALVVSDLVLRALGRTTTPEVWLSAFATADYEIVLWSAAILAAPLFEELVYRGFVIEGLSGTMFGPAGAAVVASFVWALGHFDYGVDHLFVVFALGLILGWARLRTGSLWTPIIVHALWNIVAVVGAELIVSSMR